MPAGCCLPFWAGLGGGGGVSGYTASDKEVGGAWVRRLPMQVLGSEYGCCESQHPVIAYRYYGSVSCLMTHVDLA